MFSGRAQRCPAAERHFAAVISSCQPLALKLYVCTLLAGVRETVVVLSREVTGHGVDMRFFVAKPARISRHEERIQSFIIARNVGSLRGWKPHFCMIGTPDWCFYVRVIPGA